MLYTTASQSSPSSPLTPQGSEGDPQESSLFLGGYVKCYISSASYSIICLGLTFRGFNVWKYFVNKYFTFPSQFSGEKKKNKFQPSRSSWWPDTLLPTPRGACLLVTGEVLGPSLPPPPPHNSRLGSTHRKDGKWRLGLREGGRKERAEDLAQVSEYAWIVRWQMVFKSFIISLSLRQSTCLHASCRTLGAWADSKFYSCSTKETIPSSAFLLKKCNELCIGRRKPKGPTSAHVGLDELYMKFMSVFCFAKSISHLLSQCHDTSQVIHQLLSF